MEGTMKSFSYEIKDAVGIHARPAGLLLKEEKGFQSKTLLKKGEKSADLTKLMALMSLGVKCGDTVTVSAEGPDEDAAIAVLEAFFKQNL